MGERQARARCSRCYRPCPLCAEEREKARAIKSNRFSNLQAAVVHRMIMEVAAQWGTTAEAIMSPSRSTVVYSARREAIRRLRYDFKWTLKEIAYLMDRDHSTIIHSLKDTDVNTPSTKSSQLRVDNHVVGDNKQAHSMSNYIQ